MMMSFFRARRDRLRGLRAARQVGAIIEANRRQINDDADRLMSIMQEVSARIGGGACVSYNEHGEVFIHPDLARELQKPDNKELSEILLKGARANAPRG
jgi:hypothetical protein